MKIIKLSIIAASLFYSASTLAAEYVILISVDGLLPSAITKLGKDELRGFYRLRNEGAWTDNARTDYDYTRTLPNHASMLTARRVVGENGHGQKLNDMPGATTTLHNNTGEQSYVTSIFDVAHDHGLSTALYVSKDKFILFEQSYNADTGAEDLIDDDDGKDKIDHYLFHAESRSAQSLVDSFVNDMSAQPYNLSMLHLVDTDAAGHGDKWTSDSYDEALKRVDGYLVKILAMIENSPILNRQTAIVLVADHGGTGRAHGDAKDPLNYTIPFYVWGNEVAKGADLYSLNEITRSNPTTSRPNYTSNPQPIRNGDAANLVLQLLALPPIAGSAAQINAKQDLKITSASN